MRPAPSVLPVCDLRFEIIPTETIGDRAEALPSDIPLSLSASPRHGLAPTIALAERLRATGRRVVPHLAARSIASRHELETLAARIAAVGIDDVFVIAGDRAQPVGPYPAALPLIHELRELLAPSCAIGIAGYPDHHPRLGREELMQHLLAKQACATYVVTQLCFDASRLWGWLGAARRAGLVLPVRFAIAGPVRLSRLVAVALRIGVGTSITYLQHAPRAAAVASPFHRYDPEVLVDELAASTPPSPGALAGLHMCTFNDLDNALSWQRRRCPEA